MKALRNASDQRSVRRILVTDDTITEESTRYLPVAGSINVSVRDHEILLDVATAITCMKRGRFTRPYAPRSNFEACFASEVNGILRRTRRWGDSTTLDTL